MATGPRYRVHFSRRRQGKTNYRARKRLLKSDMPRGVVRISSKHVTVQLVDFDPKGDKVLVSAHSKELAKMGWKSNPSNTPSAYLVGLLAGMRAQEKKIDEAVLDIGLHAPIKGSKVYATLKGLVDAGIEIPHDPEVLPGEDRINGKALSDEVFKSFQTVAVKIRGGE